MFLRYIFHERFEGLKKEFMRGKQFYIGELLNYGKGIVDVYTKKVEDVSDYTFEWSLKGALKMDPLPLLEPCDLKEKILEEFPVIA